jgi:hypothetical protein
MVALVCQKLIGTLSVNRVIKDIRRDVVEHGGVAGAE